MSDVILKVPTGDKCLGCMFLSINYIRNTAKCRLFNDELFYELKRGGIDEGSVRKLSDCPRSNNE